LELRESLATKRLAASGKEPGNSEQISQKQGSNKPEARAEQGDKIDQTRI
jgi:hypothetical protein